MWSGTELIGNVSLDRQVLMQNVSGVGCDTSAEELIIRGTEQVGDGRQIIVAVVKPLAATALTDRILCYGKRLHMTKGAENIVTCDAGNYDKVRRQCKEQAR